MGWDGRSENVLPRMDWYPQDYLADRKTRCMTLEEHGAYFLLLQTEWLDGPLPHDSVDLADLLATDVETFERIWKRVSRCFVKTDEGFVNPRMERERETALAHKQERQESGRRGGLAKAQLKQRQKELLANPSPSPSPSPSPKQKPPISPKGDLSDNGFEPEGFKEWWKLYPNSIGRAKALLYWTGKRKLLTGAKADHEPYAAKIIASLIAQTTARNASRSIEKFVAPWKNADSYLYNLRWKDKAAQPKKASADMPTLDGKFER